MQQTIRPQCSRRPHAVKVLALNLQDFANKTVDNSPQAFTMSCNLSPGWTGISVSLRENGSSQA